MSFESSLVNQGVGVGKGRVLFSSTVCKLDSTRLDSTLFAMELDAAVLTLPVASLEDDEADDDGIRERRCTA